MTLMVSSSVANTQSGNFRKSAPQFLRELRFYSSAKIAIFYVLGTVNFDFDEFLHFLRAEFGKNQNSDPLKWPKLIS